VAIDALLGVTVADAAAMAAEADMVVEFPFSGVPGNKTFTYKSLPPFIKILQIDYNIQFSKNTLAIRAHEIMTGMKQEESRYSF